MLSEAIANALKTENDIFHTVSATGGYVNFFLTDSVWREIFHSISPTKKSDNQKTIIVDYIGANVGKPLHIGHICTPSIGQTLCNVYTHLGYRVIGDSHFGDWGGIFGKLIYQWKNTNYILSTNFHDNSISRIDCERNDWQLKEACLQNQ
jgi:arginyl-tRNA synthetase